MIAFVLLLAAFITPAGQSLTFPVPIPGTNAPANARISATIKRGPVAPILAVAFSPDGKTLAAGGYQEVLLWDLEGAKLSRRISTAGIAIHAIAWSQDSSTLFVADGTPQVCGSVRAIDIATGETKPIVADAKDDMLCLALSPNGKLLAAGGSDGKIRVISVPDRTIVTNLQEHNDRIVSVDFSPDGEHLLGAGADRAIVVWQIEDWKPLPRLSQPDSILAAAFSPDGDLIAVAGGTVTNASVRVMRFDPEAGTTATNRLGKPKRPGKNTVAQATRILDCGTTVPQSVLWATNTPLTPFQARKLAQDPAFAKKLLRIYAPAESVVKIFNASTDITGTLSGHDDWVYAVALNANQTRLATAGADGTIKLWNTSDNRLLATFAQVTARSDDWLIMTARGFFTASSPNLIDWNLENLQRPPEMVARRLERPENVQDIIAGRFIPKLPGKGQP